VLIRDLIDILTIHPEQRRKVLLILEIEVAERG
jgi:hypothetical protein